MLLCYTTIEIASGTALKTIAQLVAPSTSPLKILKWWCDFQGVVTTDAPILVELCKQTDAGTGGTSGTSRIEHGDISTLTFGSTALYGPAGTWTAEPTKTDVYEARLIHPQGRHTDIVPFDSRIMVPASGRLAIVVTAAVTVDVVAGFWFDE